MRCGDAQIAPRSYTAKLPAYCDVLRAPDPTTVRFEVHSLDRHLHRINFDVQMSQGVLIASCVGGGVVLVREWRGSARVNDGVYFASAMSCDPCAQLALLIIVFCVGMVRGHRRALGPDYHSFEPLK
jgi:hypothetical protein